MKKTKKKIGNKKTLSLVDLINQTQHIIEEKNEKEGPGKTENAAIVLYKDVSTTEQQIKIRKSILETYCKKRHYNIVFESIRENSGAFTESVELMKLVDKVKNGEVDVIVITNPFDITPVGFPLIKKLFASVGERGARIEIVPSLYDALK